MRTCFGRVAPINRLVLRIEEFSDQIFGGRPHSNRNPKPLSKASPEASPEDRFALREDRLSHRP